MGLMTDATENGTHLEKLKALEKYLAQKMDSGEGTSQDAKQYRETLADISYLEGSQDDGSELDDLLS